MDKGFNNDMNDQGAIDVLTTLLSKKWPDEEIPTDITFLRQQLQKDIKELRCACARTRTRGRSLFWCRVAGGARGGGGHRSALGLSLAGGAGTPAGAPVCSTAY